MVLLTQHAVPGLPVDAVVTLLPDRVDVNVERAEDAQERIRAAVQELRRRGEKVTIQAVAKLARASNRTVKKYLRRWGIL